MRRGVLRIRVGVLCPSRFEYEAIKGLSGFDHAAVHVSGMGKVRGAAGVFDLHRRHPRLRHLLLIGFVGGLSGLRVGDVIEPDCIIEQDYCAEPFEKFPHRLRLTGRRLLPDSLRATLLTQDRFLKDNPYADSDLARHYPRLACDMEGYAVAWSAQRLGLGCSVAKLVSDEANADADHDFLKACRDLRPKLQTVVQVALSRLR